MIKWEHKELSNDGNELGKRLLDGRFMYEEYLAILISYHVFKGDELPKETKLRVNGKDYTVRISEDK